MDHLLTTIYLFGALLTTLFLGVHVAFALGGVSIAFIYFYLGPGALGMVPLRAFRAATAFEYTAIPLFIFMASMLQHSGIAERLFSAMHSLFGKLRGGLAAGTIGVATIFAAMSGISGAATISMGIIAVPAMLSRGYSKQIALGSVAAGGSLGILIPPSVTMIIYGVTSGTSIGRLYSAGLLPGLLIAGLFVIYVLVLSWFRKEKIATETSEAKATLSTYVVGFFAPMVLIVVVLGSILVGFASIGEAAALGAFGAALMAPSMYRKATWRQTLSKTCAETMKYTCMIFWIIILASAFSTFYTTIGASRFIEGMVLGLELNRYVILAIMMMILLMLGMVLDTVGIILITLPIFAPIANSLGFDPVWFGILYIINMEIGFLTPPFGYNLFYLKGVAPAGVTMVDIYKSVIPFILLMLLGIVLCAAFPSIILVLPNLLFG